MNQEPYSHQTHLVIRVPDILGTVGETVEGAILETTSWGGWGELQQRHNRKAIMKATTLGFLHIAWILFLSSGGILLVWLFPKTRDYCYNLVYILSMFLVTSFVTPIALQGVIMGISFWVAGLSFAPTQNFLIVLPINALFMHLHTNEFIRAMMTIFVFRNLWTTPRIWDINPCSLIFGVIVFLGCTSVAMHVLFHYIPAPVIPLIIIPTYTFPDPFGDRFTNAVVSLSTASVPFILLYIIGSMRMSLEEYGFFDKSLH